MKKCDAPDLGKLRGYVVVVVAASTDSRDSITRQRCVTAGPRVGTHKVKGNVGCWGGREGRAEKNKKIEKQGG
jgi:hypothetical protein